MLEGWTTLGTLRRLLVVFTKIEKHLASLADTSALGLKLQVLQHGASIDELRSEPLPAATDQGWVDDQDEEELAELDRQERALTARGGEVDEAADLGVLYKQWLNAEEGGKEK